VEFADVVRRRRMVRRFTDEPVDPGALERILQAAQRGPSAGYSQGVSLVVVTEATTRQRLAEVAGESWYVNAGHFPFISQAPVHVVVCTSPEAYVARYRLPDKQKPDGQDRPWPVPYWYTDAGCVMMLLLLAAVDEGLATAFVGVRDPHDLATALAIPDDVLPIGIALIGHGAADKPSRSLQRGRRSAADVVHRERW
jgi:nitroreductase